MGLKREQLQFRIKRNGMVSCGLVLLDGWCNGAGVQFESAKDLQRVNGFVVFKVMDKRAVLCAVDVDVENWAIDFVDKGQVNEFIAFESEKASDALFICPLKSRFKFAILMTKLPCRCAKNCVQCTVRSS